MTPGTFQHHHNIQEHHGRKGTPLTCTTRAAGGRWRTSRTRTPPPDSSARSGIDLQAKQASSFASVSGRGAGLGELYPLLGTDARSSSTRVTPSSTERRSKDAEQSLDTSWCGDASLAVFRGLSIIPAPYRDWPIQWTGTPFGEK